MAFKLSNQGYFGDRLKKETEKIKEIKLVDKSNFTVPIVRIPVRPFVLLAIFTSMIGGWSHFIHGQYSREFFMMEHPKCHVDSNYLIGDGRCHGEYNTTDCGYDGGDCIEFYKKYPNCNVTYPEYIGDGYCYGG